MVKHTEGEALASKSVVKLSYAPEKTEENYVMEFTGEFTPTQVYLMQVGFGRVVGGAANNSNAVVSARMVKEALGAYERTSDGDHSARDAAEKAWKEENKAAIASAVVEDQARARREAFEAVLDGTIQDKAQGVRDPLAAFVNLVLDSAIKKAAAAQGASMPTGKALSEARAALMAHHGEAKVRAKAEALRASTEL